MMAQAETLFETQQVFPPLKGVVSPYKGIYNPLEEVGRATTFHNWRIRGDVLQLVDGYAEQGTSIAAARVKMIASYKSSTKDDLIFVAGRILYYYVLTTPSVAPVAVATILASDTSTRIAWVRFRNRFLLATLADGLWWYDPDNRTARLAGNVKPSSGVTLAVGAAGALTGTYTGWVSYINDQGHESNLADATGTVAVTAQKVEWSAVPTGPAGTSKRYLYRSTAGGSTPLFLVALNDNTTTVYSDNNADTALGAEHEGSLTVPTTTIRNIAATATRVYLVDTDGTTVWASKFSTDTGLPNWEAYPSSLSRQYPFLGGIDKAQSAIAIGQTLYVFGNLGGYRTLGDVASSSYTEPLPWNGLGFLSPHGYKLTPEGLIFIDNEKKLRLFDGSTTPRQIAENLWGYLDTIHTGAGLDGPDMEYDAPSKCVYINYGTASGGANNKTLLYYTTTKEGSTADWAFDVSYYSHTDKLMYSSIKDQTKMFVTSGYKANGTAFSSQKVEFLPITPVIGDKSYMVRLVMVVKAQPIASGVVPMLKVEYAFDDGAFFESRYVDVSKDFLVYSAGQGNVKRVIEVPLYKRAESITVRISAVNNTASLTNGQEIYALAIHYQPSAEAKMSRRYFPASGRVTSSTPA